MREAPALLVLLAVAAGLVLTSSGHWRSGLYGVGLALLLAAGLRSSLPTSAAGLLVVRSRALDVLLLLAAGSAVLLLTNAVPEG